MPNPAMYSVTIPIGPSVSGRPQKADQHRGRDDDHDSEPRREQRADDERRTR
jgi:hypothetical protein